MECEAGRTAFCGGKWREPCPEEATNTIPSPQGDDALALCDQHFEEASVLFDGFLAMTAVIDHMGEIEEGEHVRVGFQVPSGNAFRRDIISDDVFIVRDPTMVVPELMRCTKCHEFIVEGSRCTFIGEHYRHLVHATCVGLH